MLQRITTLVVSALLFALPASAQTPGSYQLRPGDQITVDLFTAAGQKVDVVSGNRVLDRDGNVYLPYVGSVHLAGSDEQNARKVLVERYSHFYSDPVVNVKVDLRVNITGAVAKPGQYFLDPTATILDALSNAGGITSEVAAGAYQVTSDPRHVRVVRDGRTLILDMRPDEIADSVTNMRIHSGDWINVPPQTRSRIRDDVTFWGGIASLATSIVALIILTTRH
jgi:polysaccharide biosynthesis/export protein